ncbi:MAG: type II toxin-antitoxin system VapC family toxin [Propionibacteriaceae bacterium]|jgi:predicted nucleic-acid-binding protein|nr:type II toxin-antitoxin system VapC family toxin [Propionibacteriaceae bacterium]
MIGLDTNVVVRHLTDDDLDQSPRAHALFESLSVSEPGFISLVVLVETHWVLRRAYRYTTAEVHAALAGLLGAYDIVVEAADEASWAMRLAERTGADFADCLIQAAAAKRGCRITYTFDAKAARLLGMAEPPRSGLRRQTPST